ncbi:MAG: preprotein translocase subunit SecY [Deltaproteobacteria bacterium]|nr:preprotein translocase subunit SecY [Deltaproteobacteria bacterium]
MASTFGNIPKLPELRKRIFFTIFMLGIYRLGVYVPTPGINAEEISKLVAKGTVLETFNLFSGGALERFSVFALGIMPYISASIILQLLTVVVPSLEQIKKDGEQGRKKITQWTRYGTILLSIIQGLGISYGLESQGALLPGVGGVSFYFMTVVTLAAGTSFIMWLGEQITERGIGNGISLIIFAGIVARIPSGFRAAWGAKESFLVEGLVGFLLVLAFIAVVVGFILFMERAQRRIPVQYAKRMVGRKMYSGQSSHLPLKINTAGVIPPIFASSLLLFPATIARFSQNETLQAIQAQLGGTGLLYNLFYILLIIFFCYFYTAVTFNPVEVSDNIKKYGGFIPGIRPGKPTADFIDRILSRLTLGGGIYVAFVCTVPTLLLKYFGAPDSIAYTVGGTSVLILVGVAMDTIAQIESHLLARNYEGFLGAKGGKFKGRKR